jgi:hypothetical protein
MLKRIVELPAPAAEAVSSPFRIEPIVGCLLVGPVRVGHFCHPIQGLDRIVVNRIVIRPDGVILGVRRCPQPAKAVVSERRDRTRSAPAIDCLIFTGAVSRCGFADSGSEMHLVLHNLQAFGCEIAYARNREANYPPCSAIQRHNPQRDKEALPGLTSQETRPVSYID